MVSGIMGVRLGLWFLLVLSISWACVDARTLVISDVSIIQENYNEPKIEFEASGAEAKNARVCTLCEEFTEQAVGYLSENKTQTEVFSILHLACSQLHGFKQECITMVDYYVPLFFSEVAMVQPGEFCQKVNLCGQTILASENSCTFCHQAVEEIRVKLDDPDAQFEIIEALMKVCTVSKNYAAKCKKLVFEYGPLILSNAEQFLEKDDLCTIIHACKASADGNKADSSDGNLTLLSES